MVVSLVIGYLAGRAALKLARGRRSIIWTIGLTAVVAYFVCLVAAGADRRFFVLAAGAFGLVLAWFFNSSGKKAPAIHSDLHGEA
jgi:hypothetical protein